MKMALCPAQMVTMATKVAYLHTFCLLWMCGKLHRDAMIITHLMIKYVILDPAIVT